MQQRNTETKLLWVTHTILHKIFYTVTAPRTKKTHSFIIPHISVNSNTDKGLLNCVPMSWIISMLLFACFSVFPLPSACESARVLSGMRAGLWTLNTVLWGGIAGSGGSGSSCAYVLPVAQPQLPAGHPGRLLPGWRYGLCGLRFTTTHHHRLQL